MADGADERDYFAALGVSRRFAQDREALQKRFYEASRALHPDRFTTAGPEARAASLERMSLVNEAWRTLKDPALLREYYLGLHAPAAAGQASQLKKAAIPMDLAEAWFEIQDLLIEEPATGAQRLLEFAGEIQSRRLENDRLTQNIEKELDHQGDDPEPGLLAKLRSEIQTAAYLDSLERDIRVRNAKSSGDGSSRTSS